MSFQRPVDLAKPFSAGRGPPAAPLVERQLQVAQQIRHLLAGGHMGHVRPGAQRRLVEIVQRCQTARTGRKPSRNESWSSPSAMSCLLREPSIDSLLRTTIQSVVAPSRSRRCLRAVLTIVE